MADNVHHLNYITSLSNEEELIERFKAVIKASNLGYFDLDFQSGEQYVNDRWFEMFGLKREDISFHESDWWMLCHPGDVEKAKEVIEKAIDTNKPYIGELRMNHKDGHWVHIRVRGALVTRDPHSNIPLRFCGTTEDISEEVEAREKLLHSNQIIETSSDMIASINEDYTFLTANKAYLDAFNLIKEEVIGRTFSEVFGNEFFKQTIKPQMDKTTKMGVFRHQFWWDFPLIGKRYMDISNVKVTKSDGSPNGYSVFARDLTDEKNKEDKLHQVNEKYKVLIDSMDIGVVFQTADGVIQTVNNAALEILGLSLDEMQGRSSLDPRWKCIHEDGSPFPGETHPTIQTLKTGIPAKDVSMGIYHSNGTLRWISINCLPLFHDGEKTPYAIIGTFRNNTDKITEEERNKNILESSFIQAIHAISSTAEKRDPYTSGHMERVAELAVQIGLKLGLDENMIKGIELGGVIHDIGKIYIPAEILNRPGKLSKSEFEMIKTHSQVGYEIIKDIDFPWPVAEMVLSHHERLDGSGYPNGLKGDEITLEARILAVADVIEAVSSHRPYRPALGIEEGIKIIKEGKGHHFDPKVVDACIDIIADDKFEFSETL